MKVVVPDGYTGPVTFVFDPKNGADIPWQEGNYKIVVPADGVLRVKTFDPFEQWHKETWVYANGHEIPNTGYLESPDAKVVMVRLGNSAVSNDVRWIEHFVGTEAQLDEYLRTPHAAPK